MHAMQEQYLSNHLRNLQADMKCTIQAIPDHELDSKNISSSIEAVMQKYLIEPLQFFVNRAELTTHQKTIYARDMPPSARFGRGINPHDPRPLLQQALMCHIPFSGDATLLKFDPTYSSRLSLPKLIIRDNEISFEVMINENQPSEARDRIQAYKNCIQQQIQYINNDLIPYNSSLKDRIQKLIDKKEIEKIKMSTLLFDIGIPMRETEKVSPSLPSILITKPNQLYYSAAISYGGLDEIAASTLNNILTTRGCNTWFYPDDGVPGEKLHRMMFDMINHADRVILLCSKTSLHRAGVLNEIERTLEREAKEGGSTILMPITLDDYVYEEWSPQRKDFATQIRARNIIKLDTNNFDSELTLQQIEKILLALTRKL
jgi:hypothetical protein